mgnify:CR=1 FL=1
MVGNSAVGKSSLLLWFAVGLDVNRILRDQLHQSTEQPGSLPCVVLGHVQHRAVVIDIAAEKTRLAKARDKIRRAAAGMHFIGDER